MTTDNDLKVRENRLRRVAARQGMFLSKRRRRDQQALDYSRYALFRGGEPVHGVTKSEDGRRTYFTHTLGEIEAILAVTGQDEKPSEEEAAAQAAAITQPRDKYRRRTDRSRRARRSI